MIVEKAYAKINLGLEVVRKREDSYHELAMVMTSISLSDELYFEDDDTNKIKIDCEKMNHIGLENNLIYKSAILLKERYGIKKGVKIKVVKNIPEQAGLGGGSADSAATLRGLNQLWGLGLELDELASLGFELGSDIPFCIYNKTAKVTGTGEIIEFIDDVPYLNLILAFPNFKVSTAEVFKNFIIHGRNKGKINKLISSISSRDIDDICNNLFNDLEYSYYFREIAKIKSGLTTAGAKAALMTGSGSTVFGICLNEKDAIRVANKFTQSNKSMDTLIVQTRSNIKYKWSGQARTQVKYKTLDSTKTKAYGYISLVHQSVADDYVTIKAPLTIYNEVFIEKVNIKVSELYLNEYLEENDLSRYIETLVDNLEYGLRVKIKQGVYNGFGLIDPENYLASIINALIDFGEDVDKLFSIFPNIVKAYKNVNTFYYESKEDKLEILDDAVFGYALAVDLGIKSYKNPRYTKQIEIGEQVNKVKEAIEEKNFYKLAENLYNSLSKFEIRNIEASSNLNIYKIQNDCLKFGAQGVVLSVDGKSLIVLARYEKHIKSVRNILKNFYNLRKTLLTSIRSNSVHQVSYSEVLIDIPIETVKKEKPIQIEDLDLFIDVDEVQEDFSEYDFDDYSNPFGEDGVSVEKVTTIQEPKSKLKTKTTEKQTRDLEGMLYIHSGGSLFKLYDFVDVGRYFEKYFHNKQIAFKINDELEVVGFKVDNLPHLLGLHYIDIEDENFRGRKGFEQLISGKITYRNLRQSLNEKTFKQIINRVQGSVLIFNDIYHGVDKELICFDKEILSRDESKLKNKLKYGITRGVAGNRFHTRNVLGIGYEEESDLNYFITSFLWGAQASLGKKEGYKVKIVKR